MYKFIKKIPKELPFRLLSSTGLTWLILLMFVIQSLWIAFSFRYPMVFDEYYHFELIKAYTVHAEIYEPVIENQPTSLDYFRDLAHETSTFFHYILSIVYRVVSLLTSNNNYHIIILRLLNILLVAAGLYLFARLFKSLGIGLAYINSALMFFVLIPLVPFVAATINYDNAIFALLPVLLILFTLIIKDREKTPTLLLWLIIVGLFGSLLKYTFLVIFMPILLATIVVIIKRHGRNTFSAFRKSIKTINPYMNGVMILLVILVGLLSIRVYGVNLIQYQSLHPTCQETMGADRCKNSPIIQRNINLASTKDLRQPLPQVDFTLKWIGYMTHGMGISAINPESGSLKSKPSLPFIYNGLFFFGLLSTLLLLVNYHHLFKSRAFLAVTIVGVFYILSIYLKNYQSYYSFYNEFIAVQSRYLLPVLPIFMVGMAMAWGHMLRGRYKSLASSAVFIVVGVTIFAGGGVVTHIRLSEESWYWKTNQVREINKSIKYIID